MRHFVGLLKWHGGEQYVNMVIMSEIISGIKAERYVCHSL